ncbi:hypothetical protein [Burkholderia vietnamiensis]|uniref:hypothetical protein n=1 Tax=Burkholderia vietnamiensis TaxID=60552 RepID=UPI001CF2CD99|nr:hypothetical protein [Burkholderia vietnamiensis]MCA8228231.1 hypothetical protein [Burkholderia vietnamiensis]
MSQVENFQKPSAVSVAHRDDDFVSHLGSWREALVIARNQARVALPDVDDHAYWEREIRAYDDAFGAYSPGAIPDEFRTHHAAWHKALGIARDQAIVRAPDVDDKAYWEHELRAFDRAFASVGIEPPREVADAAVYEPGKKYSGRIPEIKYLPVSAIERQEMDFRPEVMVVSEEVAANMDYSQPVEVTAFRFGKANDDTLPVVTLRDGHHRTAAAIQTGREYLPVEVRAINAKGEKLAELIAMSQAIEARLGIDDRKPERNPSQSFDM